MAKTAEGLRPFETHLVWFGMTSACLLGQLDIPKCECLCSLVAIALGTKSFGAGVRARFWEKLFFPVFSLSYLTTPPPFDFVCTIGIFEKKIIWRIKNSWDSL